MWMGLADSTFWWILAGVFVAVELVSGTFYLLMVACGLVAAALAAHLGAPFAIQLVVAAVVSGGAVLGWRSRKKSMPSIRASANRNVNLDIGETLHVETWGLDNTSTVQYRGANWRVALVAGATPSPGLHRIVEVIGSQLIVEKA